LERSARLLDLEAAKPKLEKLQKIALRLEKQLQQKEKKRIREFVAAPAPAPAPVASAPKIETEKRESGERKKHGKYF
jgi:hypothetical protein